MYIKEIKYFINITKIIYYNMLQYLVKLILLGIVTTSKMVKNE